MSNRPLLRSPRARALTRPRPARTPLFNAVRRALSLAARANHPSRPPVDEIVELSRQSRLNEISRREFLKAASLGALAVSASGLWTSCASTQPSFSGAPPKVAIVGAGIAGLNAAYKLQKAGLRADIYEGSKRAGGRMYSAKDILGPGLTTELGGEFIDSNHEEMLKLVEEFNLPMLDMQAPGEEKVIREAYFFNGRHYTETEVVEAFRPIADRLKKDFDALEEVVNFENEGGAAKLDRTPLSQYLQEIGATGWLGELLEVAFVTEYGLEAAEQSALNMLFMISTDVSSGKFEVFGDSDERFKIVGGNQRIVDELAAKVKDQIHLEQRLTALKSKGTGFSLVFTNPGGATQQIDADFVILTLPFTMLREVELAVEMPPAKKKAIAELGYGMNAKVMLGFNRKPWRELNYSGNIFSDEEFQLAWENSRLQDSPDAGLTLYSGGDRAITGARQTAEEQAKRLMTGVEKAFPGVLAARNGRVVRFHWPTYAWSKAAYACYRPGQWTTIAGAEILPVGNLLFAGEHCSADFQGFMNGGAETGKTAAETLLGMLKKKGKSKSADA